MKQNQLQGTVAFITGSSSGIGAALAKEFARCGADVVATARRADRLDQIVEEIELMGRRGLAVECDVAKDGDLDHAVDRALETFGRIDWAVANAGFGVTGSFEGLDLESYRRQFETNVFGTLRTVQATRDALEASRGSIGILGSVAGVISFPEASPYSMSKAAVHALAESLWIEFSPLGIGVTLILPGYIESEIRQVDNKGVYQPSRQDPVPAWLRMSADAAARKICRAITHRRRELVLTLHGRLAVAAKRHVPGLLAMGMRRVNRGRS